ncbi:hypothetical protein AB0A77_28400 [Streptomyces varsoviensis]|uniref:hypothetical protein n=1 Tax=Streptomyces varsoviensis TaxID=67373 RepID=UPI0033F4273F
MNRLLAAVGRLSAGSEFLGRRIATGAAAWCRRAHRDDLTGWRAGLGPALRVALLVAAAYFLARLIRAVPVLLWLIVPGWCVAAWRAAPAADTHEVPVTGPAEVAQGAADEAFRALVRDAIGDRQGVHLRDLLALIQRDGHHPRWEVGDVRAVCERLGIPVQRRVRVRGRGVTVGIHRDALAAPTGPSSASPDQPPPDPGLHAA